MTSIKDIYNKHKNKFNMVFFVTGILLGLYIFINYVFQYVAPFIIGYIISLIFIPLCDYMTNKLRIKRGISSFLCIVLLIVIVTLLGVSIISKILVEARSFIDNIPALVDSLSYTIGNLRTNINEWTTLIPDSVTIFISDSISALLSSIPQTFGSGVRIGSINVVSKLPMIFISTILTLVSGFFFIKDKDKVNNVVARYMPAFIKDKLIIVRSGLFRALGGYFRAQGIIISIIFIIIFIGLSIISYQYALFVALLIAVLDALPIIGSGTILWPWAVFNVISGDYSRALGLIIIYFVCLVARQMLEPKIVGEQIGVHPLLTLFSMYVGLQMYGFLGFILGPTIVVTIKIIREAQIKSGLAKHET